MLVSSLCQEEDSDNFSVVYIVTLREAPAVHYDAELRMSSINGVKHGGASERLNIHKPRFRNISITDRRFVVFVTQDQVEKLSRRREVANVVLDFSISDKRSREREDKNDKWHRVERSSGKFIRRLRLPENVKNDQMKNRVLTVTMCKEEKKRKTSPCPRHLQSAK
ncbi:hypothetical protein ACFX2I_037203 [Malus domestica]|uniref:SHSP domain-containing protein n=1 Tax=Malus domestica TaxID=3750 RepID=A0A498JNV9_MALDO|nr:hypothetical protein DVH24_009637 [Malus domestica]